MASSSGALPKVASPPRQQKIQFPSLCPPTIPTTTEQEDEEEENSSEEIPRLTLPMKKSTFDFDDSSDNTNEPKSPDTLQFEREMALAMKLSLEQDGLEVVAKKRKADEMDSTIGKVNPLISPLLVFR